MPSGQTRFLNLSLLRPGDVVLSTSGRSKSRGVAYLSGGPYSHAALVLQDIVWFESVARGIDLSIKAPTLQRKMPSGTYDWLLDVSEYDEIAVFRHYLFDWLRPERKQKAIDSLEQFVFRQLGDEYARVGHLAGLLRRPRILRSALDRFPRLGQVLARCIDKIVSPRKIAPGPFCSALIVLAYDEMGLDILKAPKSALDVTPSDLADEGVSYLRRTDGVVSLMPSDSDADVIDPLTEVVTRDLQRAISMAPLMGRARTMVERVVRRATSLQAHARDIKPEDEVASRLCTERALLALDSLNLQLDALAEAVVAGKILGSSLSTVRDNCNRLIDTLIEPMRISGTLGYRFETQLRLPRKGVKGSIMHERMRTLQQRASEVDLKRSAALSKTIDILKEVELRSR
jgi:hypothetical protein